MYDSFQRSTRLTGWPTNWMIDWLTGRLHLKLSAAPGAQVFSLPPSCLTRSLNAAISQSHLHPTAAELSKLFPADCFCGFAVALFKMCENRPEDRHKMSRAFTFKKKTKKTAIYVLFFRLWRKHKLALCARKITTNAQKASTGKDYVH